MLEVIEQRPMNNEYVNIMNWQTVTRDFGWRFKALQQIFITIANKKPNILYFNRQIFLYCPFFP